MVFCCGNGAWSLHPCCIRWGWRPDCEPQAAPILCRSMIELLTTAEMAEADRLAIAGGVPGITLMENAGRAVADAVAAVHPIGSRIFVVGRPGNNGGHGVGAARLLSPQGFGLPVLFPAAHAPPKGAA